MTRTPASPLHRPVAPARALFGLEHRRDLRRLLAVLVLRRGEQALDNEARALADRLLELRADLRVLLEERLRVLAALADALAVVGEPGARLLDDAGLDAKVDELARLGDALAVHDVELDLLEGRRHLVLDDLHARLVAHHLVAVLDLADAADVEAHGGVELQRVTARRRLRVAE